MLQTSEKLWEVTCPRKKGRGSTEPKSIWLQVQFLFPLPIIAPLV